MAGDVEKVRERLRSFDKERIKAVLERVEEQRAEVLRRFPLDAWPTMPLERYALGHEGSKDSFCYWMEFGTQEMGGIGGGTAKKHLIFFRASTGTWEFPPTYRSVEEAWEAVRSGFVEAFERAEAGDWEGIDSIEALRPSRVLLIKSLHMYFPDEVLPIASVAHLPTFLSLLGRPEAEQPGTTALRMNRALLAALRELSETDGWSTQGLMHFLYMEFDPRETMRVIRVTPGPDARAWDDCLSGGYVCVGWDEVGDLREVGSADELAERFADVYSGASSAAALKKEAKQLWSFRELEAGDKVVATRGDSRILAVGTVVEPGYEWRPDRSELRHTVTVEWDPSTAKEIQPQPAWLNAVVTPVPARLRDLILGGARDREVKQAADPVLAEIEAGLEWKGQVILYGPPGTGKTWTARRFAAWWLTKDDDPQVAWRALEEPEHLERIERRLSSAQVERRSWWVVASSKRWRWEQLFDDGSVDFPRGRLERNYALLQPGDLVIGYQGVPDKRVVALARVAEQPDASEADEQAGFRLEPVAPVADGPTFEELTEDARLSASEPIRNRNQGTLFALSEDEATYLRSLLTERDPDLEERLGAAGDEGGIAPLTRLTFHPSYSYEDFIEGFRPAERGGDALALQLADGVFKRVCLEARAKPKQRFLVLIDEINRANVAKVLGEVITLLEKDKRGLTITLPQSKEPFTIPPNVFLLGTMNTADRSIKLLDVALRRRFAFVELMPDTSIGSPLYGAKVGGVLQLDAFLDGLNAEIARQEGREKQIGHSFFVSDVAPVTDPEQFARIFRQEILPLLQEYCYEDYGTLADYLGDEIVDREGRALRSDVLADADRLVEALAKRFSTTAAS